MINTSKTIVFFGSGPVAAQSLKLLYGSFNIELVITKPKANKKDSVPVIDMSNSLNIPHLTVSSRKELDIAIKRKFVSKIAILVDFGIIVSQEVINSFELGIVNSHFSLLPKWRGADPITFSILSGDKLTGVSLMLLSSGMDEGQLIAQESIEIDNMDNLELTDRLIKLSDEMLKKCVPKYIEGNITPYNQSDKVETTYSRKLTKTDGKIDWNKSAETLEKEIRAYIIWPKSYTNIMGVDVIITKAQIVNISGTPGDIKYSKDSLTVSCANKGLSILRIKPAGKKEMDISSFVSGYIKRG
jgi:methionyl-tRNA formyltransferase